MAQTRRRTVRAKVLVYRHADLGTGKKPIDLSQYLTAVQTTKNLGGGLGDWQVVFRPGQYRASDFDELDFVEIHVDDGRLGLDGRPRGFRLVTAGPIIRPSATRSGGLKPQRREMLTGGDANYYLTKNEVFFNPYVVSEALKPILSLLLLPLQGTASKMLTAWFALRMSKLGHHILGNNVPLATIQDGRAITPGWIRFYENPIEELVVTQGVAGETVDIPPETTGIPPSSDDPVQNEFIFNFIQNSGQQTKSIADLRRLDDIRDLGELGRELNTFAADFPKRIIEGAGIASNMGPTWSLMQSMSDPGFNELFFDTFSSNGQPPRGYIVFRPKPFWSMAEEFAYGNESDNWSVLKKSVDFSLIKLQIDEDTSIQLGRTDQDSYTYWMVESSYLNLGGIEQQQFMSANHQENGSYYGHNLSFPIYEKRKAEDLGMGLRRLGLRSDYLQLSIGTSLSQIAQDMATLTIRAWDWYFANHIFESGTITGHIDTDHRIGRPLLLNETNQEGYIESVTHNIQLEDQPSATTSTGVTRMIDWGRFRQLAGDRFTPGYLDLSLVYKPEKVTPAPFRPDAFIGAVACAKAGIAKRPILAVPTGAKV